VRVAASTPGADRPEARTSAPTDESCTYEALSANVAVREVARWAIAVVCITRPAGPARWLQVMIPVEGPLALASRGD
jgi:hypothetical protein